MPTFSKACARPAGRVEQSHLLTAVIANSADIASSRASPHSAASTRTYLSKLEKGASYPGLEIIAKLDTVLEVEPADLPARDNKRRARTSRSGRPSLPV